MAEARRSQAVIASAATMSFEEFLERYDGVRAEWVDGQVVEMSPNSYPHQELYGFLFRLLAEFVEAGETGVVIADPFLMKTGLELPGRCPDIAFVATDHLDRIKVNHLAGPADLAVEIVSPDSLGRDRGEKFAEYEAGGVREYWIVDPQRRIADFYVLGDDGQYQAIPPDADGRYRSTVLEGLWLELGWLWTRPPLRSVRAAWGLDG